MSEVKLQQTAGGTFYLYLPKMMTEKKNLQKGDLIEVSETETSIVLSPVSLGLPNRRRDIKEFNVSEDPEDLEWKIMSSYLSGCLHARFQRLDKKEFTAEQITTANNTIQQLRGIESAINQKELEFIDVIDYEDINLYEEIERMFRVLKAMLDQNRTLLRSFKFFDVVADSLHRHWTFEKEQVNPISFFIHRVTSIELQFPNLFIKAMKEPVDCQHVAVITYILERIGDVIYGMGQSIAQIYAPRSAPEILLTYPPSYIKEQIFSQMDSSKNILENIEKPMMYFLSKNIELSQMFENSENIVCYKNAKEGLNLRKKIKAWRENFDQEIVHIAKDLNDVFLLQRIFPIAFRLRELSTYIESLSSRTCQFCYVQNVISSRERTKKSQFL
ncbi:MAG: hypothetical protein QXR19_15675 [Candidatus Jordarchaeaceae archaeon]